MAAMAPVRLPWESYPANGYGLYDTATMFGNGVLIGGIGTTIAAHLLRNPSGLSRWCKHVVTGSYRAVSTSIFATCVWLTATSTIRILGPTTSDFVVSQDPINT